MKISPSLSIFDRDGDILFYKTNIRKLLTTKDKKYIIQKQIKMLGWNPKEPILKVPIKQVKEKKE